MSSNGKQQGYSEKLAQASREAKATVVALIATIAVWSLLGFGLAGLDVQVFHTPLWVVGGTLGTWLFAIAVCVFLEKRVFADFDLDEVLPLGADGTEGTMPACADTGGSPACAHAPSAMSEHAVADGEGAGDE